MPFYDYKCADCGKTSEILHGMTAKPENLKCEFCRSASLQRVFYPVGMMKAGGSPSEGHQHASGSSCCSCSSKNCGSCG